MESVPLKKRRARVFGEEGDRVLEDLQKPWSSLLWRLLLYVILDPPEYVLRAGSGSFSVSF